ncbi:hypothetical protein PO124_01120 [Bacillus licheniformis]|nr:hypothetical protein [Bacillus licheniformis]
MTKAVPIIKNLPETGAARNPAAEKRKRLHYQKRKEEAGKSKQEEKERNGRLYC